MKSDNRAEGAMARNERNAMPKVKLFVNWLLVGIPLSWGVWKVITQSLVLFGLNGA